MENGFFVRTSDDGSQLVTVRDGVETARPLTDKELADIKLGVWPSLSIGLDFTAQPEQVGRAFTRSITRAELLNLSLDA